MPDLAYIGAATPLVLLIASMSSDGGRPVFQFVVGAGIAFMLAATVATLFELSRSRRRRRREAGR